MPKIASDSRVLAVILAHPDDESFPMGGTLAKYAAGGVRVVLVTATLGEVGIAGLDPAATARIRKAELEAAARTLGIAEVHTLGYMDGAVAQVDEAAAVEQIAAWLHKLQPQVVITFGPDGITGHPDHIAIHRLVTQAFARVVGEAHHPPDQPMRLFYLAHSAATAQGCGVPVAALQTQGPIAAIDVGAHLVTKVRAAQCHASQDPPFAGAAEEEAAQLTCHETFTLARPALDAAVTLGDLFAALPVPEPQALHVV
jgi:LmbE family N-acetylglucosaminyl deacetylase